MADPVRCTRCSVPLTKDDIGLTRKMINRGAQEFLCVPCLANHFELPEKILREKISEFRAMGCTLFEQ